MGRHQKKWKKKGPARLLFKPDGCRPVSSISGDQKSGINSKHKQVQRHQTNVSNQVCSYSQGLLF